MNALRDASIRTKLIAGLGLALLLIVLVGGAGIYNLQALNRSAGQIVTVWLPRIELLGEIKAEMAEYGLLARSLLNQDSLGEHVHVSDRMQSISQKLERDWRLYEAIPGDAEERLLYSVLRDVWGEYEAKLARMMPANGSGAVATQPPGSEAEIFASLDHAMRRIDDLITYSGKQSNDGAAARRRHLPDGLLADDCGDRHRDVWRLRRHLLGRQEHQRADPPGERGHAPAE